MSTNVTGGAFPSASGGADVNITQVGGNAVTTTIPVSGTVAITGVATAANQSTEIASLASIDGKITAVNTGAVVISSALPSGNNNIGDVDVVTLPALVAGSAIIGNVRIDQTTPGTTNGVQVNAALPAGTNGIGKLTANSGVTIGAVEIAAAQTLGTVTTVSTVTNISQQGGVAISLNTGVRDTGTQRVTIATNDVVPVTDNGGSISVDWNGTQPVTGSGNATGALRVELANNGTGVIATVGAVTAITNALPAGSNAIGKLAANSGVDIGDVDVTSIAAGTNKIGDVDVSPRTTGGWSVANFTSGDTYTALTNTAQVIKASAGKFGGYYIYNPNAVASYVMVYNVAAASVTVGTTTALLVFCIPPVAGANLEILAGIPFSNAGWSIAAATTGGGATAPSTALEAMIWYV